MTGARASGHSSVLHRVWYVLKLRRRLVLALAAAILTYLLVHQGLSLNSRLLVAWDVFSAIYVVLAVILVSTTDEEGLHHRARRQDDGRFFILWLTVIAACFSLVAIFGELFGMKDLEAAARTRHLALAGATIVLSWVLIHMTFALHYAHEYFDDHPQTGADRGGLDFPGTDKPDYWDFVYFSYTIGVAAQTADVSVLSKEMRRVVLLQSIISFIFNTTMVALVVNIAAGLA